MLQKKYGPGLDPREERRLTYVRWQLYRYDDAVIGDQLDQIETIVAGQERLAEAIGQYTEDVKRLAERE